MFLFLSTRYRAHYIKSAFKIITVSVELKRYSNVKVINSVKSWVLRSREGLGWGWGGVGVGECGVKLRIFVFGSAGFLFGFPWWHSELVAR
jgi:hypothetical protein